MTDETKADIDSMSYKSMLRLWRTAPIGSPYFVGEVGNYFGKVMSKKQNALPDNLRVRISKEIGW